MGAATLGVAIVATVLACERFFPESYEKTFSNYEAALRHPAIGPQGPVPLYTPRSAVDIRIRTMVESSASWMSFRAPTTDIATMVRSCTPVAENAVEYPRVTPKGWWPRGLSRGEKRGDLHYEYYRCRARAFTAVDPQHGEVFEWQLDH